MNEILFHAHSGLRYLVLLAGLVAFAYSLVAAIRSQPWNRVGRITLAAYTGLLDLQIVLGLILVFLRVFFPMLWGHIVMMILAALVAHLASRFNRKRPPERQTHLTAALGAGGSLVLVVAGIAALGRPIL